VCEPPGTDLRRVREETLQTQGDAPPVARRPALPLDEIGGPDSYPTVAVIVGNHLMCDKPVEIRSRDYWFKVVEFLQQSWALIDQDDVAPSSRLRAHSHSLIPIQPYAQR